MSDQKSVGTALGGVLLLVFGISVLVFAFNTVALPWKDDAIFLVSGKSFAEGRGYRLIDDPQAPPARNFPFFYPFVLSFIWAAVPDFPGNLVYFQLLSALAGAGFLWLTYCYLVRFNLATPTWALATIALTGLNPIFVTMAGIVQSEMVYSMITVGALYCLDRWRSAPRGVGKGYALLGVGLLALAPVTRYVGIALSAAAVLTFLRERNYRRATFLTLGMSVVFVPWVLWIYLNRATGYAQFFTLDIAHLPTHLAEKLLNIALLSVPYHLFPHLQPTSLLLSRALELTPFWMLWWLVRIAIPILCIAGIVRWARAGHTILVWYLVGYVIIFLLLDSETIGERHLLPISPFFTLALLQGVESLVKGIAGFWNSRWLETRTGWVVAGVSGLALLSALGPDARMMYNAYTFGHVRGAQVAETERACGAIVDWVRTNLPREAVIASGVSAFLYLYAGKTAVQINPTLDTRAVTIAEVERRLQTHRVEYFVDFHRGWGGALVSEYVHRSPDSFALLYTPGSCGEVYQVRAPWSGGDGVLESQTDVATGPS